ncbi:hypothetical protein [Actinopolymorpha sp. B9G3]|uniref:hypothetical protein n=1 Tax=Actinopolymorpha sp. B9G3 TaxID=3158970 RepID=UPI0032D8FD71
MRQWNDIDWDEPRPSIEELVGSWGSLDWEPVPIDSPSVDAYLSQVRDTHVNGGYLIGRWRAARYSDVTTWFAARNRLEEYEMHRLLFDSPVVRADLSPLEIPVRLDRVPGALKELPGGALNLDGILATIIVRGGAYKSFQRSAAEAKRLADEAVAALTGRRYEDFRLDRTHEPWTPWFFDVAWDHTLVLTDYRKAEMTVLCVTDTD